MKTSDIGLRLKWKLFIDAADATEIEQMVEQVGEAESSMMPETTRAQPPQQHQLQAAAQPLVISMPKAGTQSLSDSELALLDQSLLGGSTKNIPLTRAYLLAKLACILI